MSQYKFDGKTLLRRVVFGKRNSHDQREIVWTKVLKATDDLAQVFKEFHTDNAHAGIPIFSLLKVHIDINNVLKFQVDTVFKFHINFPRFFDFHEFSET